MNLLWRASETQLLAEQGLAKVESPVLAWQDTEGSGSDQEGENGLEHALTLPQTEAAVLAWYDRMYEQIHEPVKGQISMAEAIETGRMWLDQMGFSFETMDRQVKATLCVGVSGKSAEEVQEPYYSFWKIWFLDEKRSALLDINGVSGKILRAHVIIDEQVPEDELSGKLGEFLRLADLPEDDIILVSPMEKAKGVQITAPVKGSILTAQLSYRASQIAVERTQVGEQHYDMVTQEERSLLEFAFTY